MKVTAASQAGINRVWYKVTATERDKAQVQARERQAVAGQGAAQEDALPGAQPENDAKASQALGAAAGGGKVHATLPDDSVGQLAAQLANAQTKLDVQQVSGKAMRAMANLRIAEVLCEGKDKQKARQMIIRLEKLMKRTRTKLRHLDREEQLERQQRRAEKEQEQEKANQLRNELRNRRTKRRRDEINYALKEAAQDQKENSGLSGNAAAAQTGTLAGALPAAAMPAMPADLGGVEAAPAAAEGVSLDVTA